MWSSPIFREDLESLATLLISKNYSLSTAESCTGGMIGTCLTALPGSSQWFKGGIIAYCNTIKKSLLNVSESTLDKHGAVSSETVTAMANGAAKRFETECAIAVSGIAGPGGGTKDKPVGLVYIGIYYKRNAETFKHLFSGTRNDIRNLAVSLSIEHLRKKLALS